MKAAIPPNQPSLNTKTMNTAAIASRIKKPSIVFSFCYLLAPTTGFEPVIPA